MTLVPLRTTEARLATLLSKTNAAAADKIEGGNGRRLPSLGSVARSAHLGHILRRLPVPRRSSQLRLHRLPEQTFDP
jgi:hypothetical protein